MNNELNKFFNLSPNMLCIRTSDGYFKKINPSFQKILGWSKKDLLNKPFSDFIHPDDKLKTEKIIKELAKGKESFSYENRYRSTRGNYHHFRWTAYPDTETGNLYAIARDITDLKLTEEKYKKQSKELKTVKRLLKTRSDIDRLTKLKNQVYFDEFLEMQLAVAWRKKSPISIVILNLDNFGIFNEQSGRLCGDKALKTVAESLKKHTRTSDVISRLKKDTFGIILPDTNAMYSTKMAERLRKSIILGQSGDKTNLTASFGVSTISFNRPEAIKNLIKYKVFLREAESALYSSKENGKNCITHVNDM